MNKETVSNSEISLYRTCEYAHNLSYIQGYKSLTYGPAAEMGILGHSVLQFFYREWMITGNSQDAQLAAMKELFNRSTELDREHTERLSGIIVRYLQRNIYWRPIYVEEKFQDPLIDDIDYVYIPDIVVEILAGSRRGQFAVVDSKFTYDFYPTEAQMMLSQLREYGIMLQKRGIDIKCTILNQLRTRQMKNPPEYKLFRESVRDLTPAVGASVYQELAATSVRVVRARRGEASDPPMRVMNKEICKNCNWLMPCNIAFEGRDPSTELKVNFRRAKSREEHTSAKKSV